MSERINVEFPEIEGDPHMLIIKRFRLSGQEEIANGKKYRYSFYQAQITDNIISTLREILSNHVESIQNNQENGLPKYHPDIEELPCYVELDSRELPYWGDFIDAIKIGSESRSRRAPKKLESNLWGYLFYLHNDQYAIGYVKKLSPSKVLKKTILKVERNQQEFHPEALVHRGLLFNSIEKVEGIELDYSADLIFTIKFNESGNPMDSWGVVLNKSNFESLLDVYEHWKDRAMGILDNCRILSQVLSDEDFRRITSTVENNRQLHRMLLNPVTEQYMNEVTFEDFKLVKERFGDDISFDIDEDNRKLIIPSEEDNMEYLKAIREIISVIGCRFTKTLNDNHISKGKPEEIR